MFEDILTSDSKKVKIIPTCANCEIASYILSNYPDKILCQLKKKHMEKAFCCRKWKEDVKQIK